MGGAGEEGQLGADGRRGRVLEGPPLVSADLFGLKRHGVFGPEEEGPAEVDVLVCRFALRGVGGDVVYVDVQRHGLEAGQGDDCITRNAGLLAQFTKGGTGKVFVAWLVVTAGREGLARGVVLNVEHPVVAADDDGAAGDVRGKGLAAGRIVLAGKDDEECSQGVPLGRVTGEVRLNG